MVVLPAGASAGYRGHIEAGYDLHVLAVGDGNTVLLTTPSGRALVFDVGTDTNSDAGEVAARADQEIGIGRAIHLLRLALVEQLSPIHRYLPGRGRSARG